MSIVRRLRIIHMPIDETEAVEMARKLIAKRGPRFSCELKTESPRVQKSPFDDQYCRSCLGMGRSYWVIHFDPDPPAGVAIVGGGATIVVDAESGKAVNYYADLNDLPNQTLHRTAAGDSASDAPGSPAAGFATNARFRRRSVS
jgi:hypothetical protein